MIYHIVTVVLICKNILYATIVECMEYPAISTFNISLLDRTVLLLTNTHWTWSLKLGTNFFWLSLKLEEGCLSGGNCGPMGWIYTYIFIYIYIMYIYSISIH